MSTKYVLSLMVVLLGCGTDSFSEPPDADPPDAIQPDGSDDGGGGKDAHVIVLDSGGGDASDGGVTDGAADGDGHVAPTFRRAFISSGQWTANLGGYSGADSLCQSAATAAGLGGTWMAWLSTSTSTPKMRFTHSTVPWQLLDGTVIANDWSDLTSGALEHNIDRDEHDKLVAWSEGNGVTMTFGIAWTSTDTDGTSMLTHGSISDCSGFSDGSSTTASAAVGYISYSGTYQGFMWTDAQLTSGWSCNSVLSLLCFEQ